MSEEVSIEEESVNMRPYVPLLRCCEPCTSTKFAGKVMRTLVVVFNILFWFSGCAVVSVAVWLMAIDHATKTYYSSFQILNTALIVVLVAGILFLIISFIGMCAAKVKNEMLIALSILATLILIVAEIVGLIFFVQNHSRIIMEAKRWYTTAFITHTGDPLKSELINHVQATMECCGLRNHNDYKHRLPNVTNIPASCNGKLTLTKIRYIEPVHPEGCLQKITEHITWLLKDWPIWFGVAVVLCLEIGELLPAMFYLVYLFRRGKYEYDDDDFGEEESGLIDTSDTLSLRGTEDLGKLHAFFGELPYPKMYRVVRNVEDGNFGFVVMFDEVRKCHVIVSVEPESCAEFAGLTTSSHIIEMNGLMTQFASAEEIDYTLAMAAKEVRLVVVDAVTSALYEDHKVAINLRNVEGATQGELEYKPRLCKIEKLDSGFGFSLLYLEDRKGEYIEDLTPNGSGQKAGLKIGDRIVEVNGVNIEREKSSEVVKRIRMSGSVVYLLVVDSKTDGFFRKKAVTVTASLDDQYFTGRAGQHIATPKAKRKSRKDVKPRYCRLAKKQNEEFGLYVVIDNARIGQVIRWVDCGGAADRAGLRIGDRMVEVNGQNVEYEPHQRLIEAIGLSKRAAHIIVVDEDYDKVYKRNKPRLCRIFKEHGAFGFCVEHNTAKDGHYVEEVTFGGPAERAGLKVGDRVIQMNGVNVDRQSHEDVLYRLRACESEVVLLVIDHKSSKHYKQIVEFKNVGMDDIDYDAISIPEEPVFVPHDRDSDTESYYSRAPTLSMADSISMAETKSFASFASDMSLRGETQAPLTPGAPRQCILHKTDEEEHGFFLAVDRDRNGQIIRRVVKGGPADLAGLMNEDRILCINGERVEGTDHDEVVSRIRESGNTISFTVIDGRSDQFGVQSRPYLFRIMKGKGGYGFYLWYDDNGHYVQDVTVGSPADKAGLRCGDRLIEINGVNVEKDTHEDVFYRIKACVNFATLLAVDAKTYTYCKKNGIDVCARKAENKFSGETDLKPETPQKVVSTSKVSTKVTKKVKHEVTLKREKSDDGYGFHLAYSNSFMDASDSQGGHVVHWVGKGGPADMAGVRDGDRIISVNDVNVEEEDHEQVMICIHGNGKNNVKLCIEYEGESLAPHDVEISKENGSFGFYLWFDENGHYIEDVTIGSTADKAGLKIGDRLIQINGENVESESHENAVSQVRDSGDVVRLNVVSIRTDDIKDIPVPRTCQIAKKQGTFGFCVQKDSRGLYVEYVQTSSSAEEAGLHMGDRLLEINGKSVKDTSQNDAVGMIILSGNSVILTVLSVKKEHSHVTKVPSGDLKLGHDTLPFEHRSSINPIFHQLLGKEKIDYVVEKREYGKKKEQERSKGGTDLRAPKNDDENKEKNQDIEKTDKKKKHKQQRKLKRSESAGKKKRPKSLKKDIKPVIKPRYSKGEDNVAFVEEDKHKDYRHDEEEKASEGHYLDFTLKKVEKHATANRRRLHGTKKSDGKSMRMKDIESRIANEEKNRRAKKNISSVGPKRAHKFHLATSSQLKWSFEETNSRKPGEVITRRIGDDPNQIIELEEEEPHANDNNEVSPRLEEASSRLAEEDLMMTNDVYDKLGDQWSEQSQVNSNSKESLHSENKEEDINSTEDPVDANTLLQDEKSFSIDLKINASEETNVNSQLAASDEIII